MKNVQDAYPLSPMQQGMLFHSLYAERAGAYVEQIGWTLDGHFDERAFADAWRRVVERHPVLRTAFFWEGLEVPLQVVRQRVELEPERHDWSRLDEAERERRFAELLEDDRRRGFELTKAPLLRLHQLRVGPGRHRFVWSYHHALIDGWSAPLVLREVFLFYQAFARGRELELEKVRPFRDYVAWAKGRDAAATEAYWRETLAGFTEPTPLPMACPSTAEGPPEGTVYRTERRRLPAAATTAVERLARDRQLTVNTILQGAWGLLLGRLTDADDVVFGGVVSGRPTALPGVDAMVGPFVNTLPVRVRLPAEEPAVDWLRRLHDDQLALREHEHSPLLRVREWSELPAGAPLFETLIVYENLPADGGLPELEGGPRVTGSFRSDPRTGYPLSAEVFPGDELDVHLTYDAARFEATAVRRLLRHYTRLLRGLAEAPERPVGELSVLAPAERHQLLVEWGEGGEPRAGEELPATVPERFAEQARRSPSATAVIAAGEEVSYGELETRANRLAHRLRALGVGAETPVGVCLDRSPELVVALLGVWKAGGAYLPLDPAHPDARLAFLLGDALGTAEVAAVVTDDRRVERLADVAGDAGVPSLLPVPIDGPEAGAGDAGARPPEPSPAAGDLAYLIYTSGTTGTPKGVAVEHRQLSALLGTVGARFDFRAGDRMPCLALSSFDVFLFELLSPLLAGGTSALMDLRPAPDVELLVDSLVATTHLHAVPSLMRQIVEEAARRRAAGADFPRLRELFVGGDAVPPELLADLRRTFPSARVRVLYGPTEVTILSADYPLPEGAVVVRGAPIGRPLPGVRLELRDRRGEPVPIGVAGEILIGGAGVTRGYLGRDELTAERFPRRDGERWYRTGDLARWTPDGMLEFLGRGDDQVKVRGFRVELGEVEAALAADPGVAAAAVVAASVSGDEDRQLVAFAVPANGELPADELRARLAERLPGYMVPAAIVGLDELPTTAHGKVDRGALARRWRPAGRSTAAPSGPVEELTASLMAEVLGRERVGAVDDFFELGGHSLLATRLVSRLRQAFGVDLALPELFAAPTVEALARRIEAARGTGDAPLPPLEPVPRDRPLPLSFAQQRLWLLDRVAPARSAYNLPVALRLAGPLSVPALAGAAAALVRRHESLRTRFDDRDGEPFQIVDPPAPPPLPRVDLEALPSARRGAVAARLMDAESQRPFDLAGGRLLRLLLLRLSPEEHRLLVTQHHVVTDGGSMGILVRELATLYRDALAGAPSSLPELPLQYPDFAAWQRRAFAGDALEPHLDFWRRRLAGVPPLRLPTDRPRPAAPSWRGGAVEVALPPALAERLQGLGRGEGATLHMVLLAAFAALLHRVSGQGDLAVGTPVAGRDRLELEGMIGFFVNTLVLRLDAAGGDADAGAPSFRQLIDRARRATLDAYAHQQVPFEKLVEELAPAGDRRAGARPLHQVMFALQEATAEHFELGEATLEPLPLDVRSAKFDLALAVREGADGIAGILEYDRDLFDAATVRRLAGAFEALTAAAAEDPGRSLDQLPLGPWRPDAAPRTAVPAADPAAGHPAETDADIDGTGTTAPPRTAEEETLAEIWSGLLGLDRVGIHDDFFALGGHSLLASRLVSRVRRAFDADLSMAELFERPTIAELSRQLAAARRGRRASPPIEPVPRDRPLPLSFAQQRLWFIDRLVPGTPAYNVPSAVRFEGPLAVPALARTIAEVVRRHEVLRTRFESGAEGPVQVIDPPAPPALPVIDLEALPAPRRTPEADRVASAEARRPFDLERGPLLRTLLLRLAPADHRLVVNLHHIVSDGWSTGVLVREVGTLYPALAAGERPSLPPLPIQYADYAVRQRQELAGEWLDELVGYWRGVLGSRPEPLELPTDHRRPAVQMLRGARHDFRLPGRRRALAELCREQGVTSFMALLAVYQELLRRLTGAPAVSVGIPSAGRTRPETEALIGFFVNTLVLRTEIGARGTLRFTDLLERVRRALLGAFDHQELPFEKLVEELDLPRDTSRQPLVPTVFSLTHESREPLELPGLRLTEWTLEVAASKFDLMLDLLEEGDDLAATFHYDHGLFDRTTILRFERHFTALLDAAAAEPGSRLAELPVLSASERHQLYREWGVGRHLPKPRRTLPELIAERAAASPEAVAVVAGGEELPYAELERRAEAVAARLRRHRLAPETPVGLATRRSVDLPAAILGIWKAGCAYVPLDPGLPDPRLGFLIGDALGEGEPVIVADGEEERLRRLAAGAGIDRPRIEPVVADADAGVDGEGDGGATATAKPALDHLAYLIYTSGSTGHPKGVMVEHRQLASTLLATGAELGFEAGGRMPVLAPYSFDIFLFELFSPLLAGGTAEIFELRPAPDVEALAAALDRMTHLHAVPSLMRQLVAAVARREAPSERLRRVFVGGDAVPPELLGELRRSFPGARVRVLYGPTEGTIVCSSYPVRSGERWGAPLGQPLPGAVLRVCDELGRQVPIGVAGEIWIGGAGVARGYLHRAARTAELFPAVADHRFYRTGDRARWRADGNLEFLGRTDAQVKVRGYRIEPGEIESTLAAHPGVGQAAVVAPEEGRGGERRLVAYVAPGDPETALDPDGLRDHLQTRLPGYMVPSAVVVLGELPHTRHGKVDRAALLERGLPATADGDGGEAPAQGSVAELVAELMAGVLGVERLGADASFFDLGGHSLLAVQLTTEIRTAFGVELPVTEVFEAPTVAELARRVETARRAGRPAPPPIEPAPRDRPLPLSFAQQRLWFIDQLDPGSPAYNLPYFATLEGRLDLGALERSIEEIVERHEVLRTTFAGDGDQPVQRIAPPGPRPLPLVDLSALPGGAVEAEGRRLALAEMGRPFDLRRGPLLRVTAVRRSPREHLLILVLHHIVGDAWSLETFLGELQALYAARLSGTGPGLPELPVQYADYALWQRRWLTEETADRLLGYWRQQLAGGLPALELPLDRPRPAVRSSRGGVVIRSYPDVRRQLRELSRRQGATLYMTLLAAFQAFLSRLGGQEDFVVGTAVAGRGRPEIARLIGFFVNMLPIRADLAGDPSFAELVRRTRDTALGAFAHQELPLDRLIEELQPERRGSHMPLFQVAFGLRTAFRQGLELPGLELRPEFFDYDTARLDLSLWMLESDDGLAGTWFFSTDVFDRATVEWLSRRFATFLGSLCDDPEAWISTREVVDPEEREAIEEEQAKGLKSRFSKLRKTRRKAIAVPQETER